MDQRRARQQALRKVKLYAVLTEAYCRKPWLEAAEGVLAGGADVLQLREKELEDGELLARARTLRRLTEGYAALLIVNDRPDVAVLCGADGIHVGQGDLPPEEVRRLVGPDLIVGLSTHTPQQAAEAQERRADYIGAGPAYATATKGCSEGGGPELIARLCRATRLPVVAIGGVTPANARLLIEAGAHAVAACGALCGAADPQRAAREFLRALSGGEGEAQ